MRIGSSTVDFKGLQIDGPNGQQLIEPKIMGLLQVLVDNAGEVMTREELITAAWGVQYGGDESLSRAISILRKALGDKRGAHKHIITIPRVGYRFIMGVSQAAPVGDASADSLSLVETHISEVQASTNLTGSHIKTALPAKEISIPILKVFPKKITAVVGLLMVCLLTGFLLVTGLRTGETMSLQAKIETGYEHVANFTPKGSIGAAQGIFSDVLSDDPDHAAARAGLAFSIFREYTHLERDPAVLQRAKAHAEASLRTDEHLALANIAVAWAAEFEGDFDRSHKYLDRADILDADNKFALEGRYRTFGKQAQYRKAKEVINTAISAHPNYSLLYAYRGDFYNRESKYVAAEKDLNRAIVLAPDSARLYAQLAHSLHYQNRTEEAVSVIQQGLSVNKTALLYSNLGTFLFFQGQYELAGSAFEKTIELNGDSHEYLYWANLGDAQRWSKNKSSDAIVSYKRALQLLQAELDLSPKDGNLKSRAALFNAKLGNLDKAQNYMDSIGLTKKSPSIQLYRAVVTSEILSSRSKALQYLDLAIKADYPMIEILNDPELSLLRQDPAYHKLLAQTQN